MPPSIAASPSVQPRRPRRSPPRRPARRCSRARKGRAAAPTVGGGRSPAASRRGRERRGGAGQCSRRYPPFAEDSFARELFLHPLIHKFADALFLLGSETRTGIMVSL